MLRLAIVSVLLISFIGVSNLSEKSPRLFAQETDSKKVGATPKQSTEASSKHQTEMVEVELFDRETLKGQLYLPGTKRDQSVKTLVLFIHGTGPGTYLNKRKIGSKTFNYFDLFGKRFNDLGIAMFSYNKRGVTLGDSPPYFDKIDKQKFAKVLPGNEVRDLVATIEHLKSDKRFKDASIVLLGWSEGTMLASLVAEKAPGQVDALLLAGYAHDNLFDIIKWQFSGASSMTNIGPYFDANGDGEITQEEYESEKERPAMYRKRVMQGAKFKLLDANGDGRLVAADFAQRVKPFYETLLKKATAKEDQWIWKNYFRISSGWLREHFSLEPNKTRLTRLKIPIYVFHGTSDANVDVNGVHDLKRRFETLGKTNLKTFVFDKHDHDLNFLQLALRDKTSEGLAKIFAVAKQLNER